MADDRKADWPLTDDEENIVIDTTSTEPLREAQIEPEDPDKSSEFDTDRKREKFTSPRFGSAGSGGAEFEPGPPRGPDSA